MAVIALLALLLCNGMRALLIERWGWAPYVAIAPALAIGLAMIVVGLKYTDAAAAATRRRAFAIGLIVYAALLRLIYAGSVELLPEETYYWNYAQHLDYGYLDHPPLVAWLIRFGTAVFGQNEFGVRFGALCGGAVTSLCVYELTRNLFGKAAALAALLLAQALPFFFLSGLLMTPDALLSAAWAASLYFIERALIAGRSRAWWFAGISLGFGLIAKYSIALLAPVILLFMAWDAQSRRWWRRLDPYIGALLAIAIFSPVLLWNARHDWASFAFQTSRRLSETPKFTLHVLIASCLLLITPTGVLALAPSFKLISSAGPEAARRKRLLSLAILIPLAVFALFSLRHEVKLDWTGALWSAALPVLGLGMIGGIDMSGHVDAGPRPGRFAHAVRAAWPPTLVFMMILYAAGLHYLVLGLPGVGYGKHIELVPVGWRDLSAHIGAVAADQRARSGEDVLIVGMDRYAITSEIAFYGNPRGYSGLETVNSHLFGGMGLMYGEWMPANQQEGRTLLLVAFDPAELTQKAVMDHVERVGPIEDDVLLRDGKVIRHYYHRFAYGFRQRLADPAKNTLK